MVPLWAGISEGGFTEVNFHKSRKLDTPEWTKVIKGGHFKKALLATKAVKARGAYRVLADNERFLKTKQTKTALERIGVELWHVPPSSPDLNPVERFWGWLRRQLRLRDLKDLKDRRPPVTKAGLRARVRQICRTKRAQAKARNFARGLRKVWQTVVQKRGGASGK